MEQVERDLEDAVIDEVVGESAEAVSLGDQFSWDDDVDFAPEVDTTEIMDQQPYKQNVIKLILLNDVGLVSE